MAYRLPDIAKAFNEYVDTDIPNVTVQLQHVKDYSQYHDAWDKYPSIRAFTSIINWKSNVNNADMTYNYRSKLTDDLTRGDMLYSPDNGSVGMINWNVDSMVDCKKTQVTTCNAMIVIMRHIPEVVDKRTGMLVAEAHDKVIVQSMPVVFTEMYGRYDYAKNQNTPGIIISQAIEVKLQANPETLGIKSGDFFVLRGEVHNIMVVNCSQLSIDGTKGVLDLICDRSEAN